MSDAFLGEIRLVPYQGGRVPQGWLACDGRLLQLQQYVALYALLGVSYGGDGTTNFALPDLRGRVPISQGQGLLRGIKGGSETVTLDQSTMAPHTHAMAVSSAAGTQANTVAAVYAASPTTTPIYGAPTHLVAIAQSVPQLRPAGNNPAQPHENRQPYLALTYIICTSGLYPPRP